MSVTITGYLEFVDTKADKHYAQVHCRTPYPHIAPVTILTDQESNSTEDLITQVLPFWSETVTMECDVDVRSDTITTSAKRMVVVR